MESMGKKDPDFGVLSGALFDVHVPLAFACHCRVWGLGFICNRKDLPFCRNYIYIYISQSKEP